MTPPLTDHGIALHDDSGAPVVLVVPDSVTADRRHLVAARPGSFTMTVDAVEQFATDLLRSIGRKTPEALAVEIADARADLERTRELVEDTRRTQERLDGGQHPAEVRRADPDHDLMRRPTRLAPGHATLDELWRIADELVASAAASRDDVATTPLHRLVDTAIDRERTRTQEEHHAASADLASLTTQRHEAWAYLERIGQALRDAGVEVRPVVDGHLDAIRDLARQRDEAQSRVGELEEAIPHGEASGECCPICGRSNAHRHPAGGWEWTPTYQRVIDPAEPQEATQP